MVRGYHAEIMHQLAVYMVTKSWAGGGSHSYRLLIRAVKSMTVYITFCVAPAVCFVAHVLRFRDELWWEM